MHQSFWQWNILNIFLFLFTSCNTLWNYWWLKCALFLCFLTFKLGLNPIPFLDLSCLWLSEFLPSLLLAYFFTWWERIFLYLRLETILFLKLFLSIYDNLFCLDSCYLLALLHICCYGVLEIFGRLAWLWSLLFLWVIWLESFFIVIWFLLIVEFMCLYILLLIHYLVRLRLLVLGYLAIHILDTWWKPSSGTHWPIVCFITIPLLLIVPKFLISSDCLFMTYSSRSESGNY